MRRILTEDGRAVGVELATGRREMARAVLANVDVKTTFEKLVAPEALDPEFLARVRRIRPGWRRGRATRGRRDQPRGASSWGVVATCVDRNVHFLHIFTYGTANLYEWVVAQCSMIRAYFARNMVHQFTVPPPDSEIV